jgi:hypothetical protein
MRHLAIALAALLLASPALAGDAPVAPTATPSPEEVENRVAALFAAGDLAGLIAYLEPLARSGDGLSRSFLASALARTGRHGEALPVFEALAAEGYERPPNDTVGWHLVRAGICYEALGRLEDAGGSFGRACAEPDRSGHLAAARAGLERIAAAVAKDPRIAFVEVFGGSQHERAEALDLAGLRRGAALHAPGRAAARLAGSGRFRASSVFPWPEAPGEVGVLIDIVGAADPEPPPFAAPPRGDAPPPAEAVEASAAYSRAFAALVLDPSPEKRRAHDDAERRSSEVADRHLDALLRTIREDGDPARARVAGYLLGFATSVTRAAEIVAALATRFDDPDEEVRNATLRSAGILETRLAPQVGHPLNEAGAVLRAFSRPGVLDRQKASVILAHLARDPALRPRIRAAALERTRAIAATGLAMHRRVGLALLREIEGERRLTADEWRDWLTAHARDDVAWWEKAVAEDPLLR